VFTPDRDPNVKREVEQKFSESKNLPNFDLLWGLGSGGIKSFDFTANGIPLREPTSIEPFASKLVRGVTSRSVGEKKVTETPIG